MRKINFQLLKTYSSIILFLSLGLVACSGSKSTAPVNEDLVGYEITLTVKDEAKLRAEELELLNEINKGMDVSFSNITDLFKETHVSYFNGLRREDSSDTSLLHKGFGGPMASAKEIDQFVQTVTMDQSAEDPHALKVAYEATIEKERGELLYDASHVTVSHITKNNRLQCYSGTSLQQIAVRSLLSGKKFEEQNYVAIYTPGHILPGYMKKDAQGDWNLHGIETTASGRAELIYGPAKDLKGAIRVVDAGLWMLIEIYKQELSNSEEVLKIALRQTAEKYGIPLEEFSHGDLTGTNAASAPSPVIKSSIFGFGSANPPEKPQVRAKFDQKPASQADEVMNGSYAAVVDVSADGRAFPNGGFVEEYGIDIKAMEMAYAKVKHQGEEESDAANFNLENVDKDLYKNVFDSFELTFDTVQVSLSAITFEPLASENGAVSEAMSKLPVFSQTTMHLIQEIEMRFPEASYFIPNIISGLLEEIKKEWKQRSLPYRKNGVLSSADQDVIIYVIENSGTDLRWNGRMDGSTPLFVSFSENLTADPGVLKRIIQKVVEVSELQSVEQEQEYHVARHWHFLLLTKLEANTSEESAAPLSEAQIKLFQSQMAWLINHYDMGEADAPISGDEVQD